LDFNRAILIWTDDAGLATEYGKERRPEQRRGLAYLKTPGAVNFQSVVNLHSSSCRRPCCCDGTSGRGQPASPEAGPSRLKVSQAVSTAVIVAIVGLLAAAALEQFFLPDLSTGQMRLLHLTRGFLATSGGMVFMWWIMHHKEQELTRLRDQFKEQLSARTAELEGAVAACQVHARAVDRMSRSVVQQREDFLRALKLRLSTPAMASHRALTHLLEGEYGELTTEQKQVVGLLADNCSELQHQLLMLVDLYRYQTGDVDLRLRTWTLDKLLRELETRLTVPATGNRLAVRYEAGDGGVAVECDFSELSRLFQHLLDNASTFARSEVTIKGTWLPAAHAAVIAVEDDGPGIPPEDLPRLFQGFQYVSETGKYYAGATVGLCLCAEIARAHGGTIAYESAPSGGARFVVSLPVIASDDATHTD